MGNLHLTLLDKFGVPLEKFGDSTGGGSPSCRVRMAAKSRVAPTVCKGSSNT